MAKRIDIESFHPHQLEFTTFGETGRGPRVLVTAGVHGGEGTGVYAARRIMAWLQEHQASLNGQVTVLPVANPAAFRQLQRTSPYDDLDLNRIFPGRPEGSPSLVTASTIWEEAQKCDYIVDLHCCGIFGSDYTLALWQEFDFARELAGKLDIPVVIQSGGTRNQLFVEACHAGIPAVVIELAGGQMGSGGGLVNRESGDRAFRAVTNLLMRLGVAAGSPEPAEATPTFYGKLQDVTGTGTGLWVPAVRGGEQVKAGQLLGHLEGEPIRCELDGIATSVRWEGFVFPGTHLANIAPRQ